MKNLFLAMFAVSAFLAAVPASAEEDCRLRLAASLPIEINSTGGVNVQASINGQPIKLEVDTGSPNSVLRESVSEKLGLEYEILLHNRFEMFGGLKMHHYVILKDFVLGGLKANGIEFLLMPENDEHRSVPDGLLGEDVLAAYDIDFDFANAKLNLFAPHPCEGRVVYWTQDEGAIAKVPVNLDHQRNIEARVEVDGKQMTAIFDTGASDTVMDLEADMPKFGLTPNSPGMKRLENGNNAHPSYSYVFDTLTFEGVTVKKPRIVFVSEEVSHDREDKMLLGIEILRQLHIFIAHKEHMLYVTAASAH